MMRQGVAGALLLATCLSPVATSAQTAETRAFAARLEERLDVPVTLYDERFTTTLAQRRPGEAAEDSRAAAVLLEDWLRVQSSSRGDLTI